ncbi:hypothetical protein AB0436_08820 [Streptomyces sp. NPDC051322]|uniref:hypothetical protein n=1 Tax=Streptomyces sp. NPDC051322 TaxID=3154645 RepID=UPI0034508D0F
MSARPSPLEGQPLVSGGKVAELALPAPAVGALKVVAEGVRTAVVPDPQQSDGRYVIGVLTIRAPKGAIPTATSKCACGRDRSAVGHRKVLALIEDHTAHRDACPLHNPDAGRTAA